MSASAFTGAVIFLHGSGGDGEHTDYVLSRCGFKKQLADIGLELICPTAKSRPYSLCGGMHENVWYDRLDLSPEAPEDPVGVNESYQQLLNIVTGLMDNKGIASNRIFIGGFSMGGGMSLHFMSRFPGVLAGVFCLSSFLATESVAYENVRPLPPIIMCHGRSDTMVKYDWGHATAKRLYADSRKRGSTGEGGVSADGPPRVAFYRFSRLGHEFDLRVLEVLGSFILSGGLCPVQHEGRVVLGDEPKPEPVDIKMDVRAVDQDGNHEVIFYIPEDKVASVLSKPVATRGAHFSFTRGPTPGSVATTFYSPKPEVTAAALREKVRGRLLDSAGDIGVSSCTPS